MIAWEPLDGGITHIAGRLDDVSLCLIRDLPDGRVMRDPHKINEAMRCTSCWREWRMRSAASYARQDQAETEKAAEPAANTHYAVISFSGDPASEHPDEALRGRSPHLDFIAAGPETFCWEVLAKWTASHPLQLWQEAEVLARDPLLVRRPISNTSTED